MHFTYPYFLFASAAIAIPIIIHLFYFRRFKTVYFTNVKFLQELKEETASRSKLRNLLILLMRCLAVLAAVLAFAQPFIPANDDAAKQGKKAVSIFVDNSYSMAASDADVPLLEKAKQRAREIVAAYAPDDEFQILTADFEGKHQRLVSKDDALKLIDEIKISPATQDLIKVMNRQKQVLRNSTTSSKTAFIISDFQRSQAVETPKIAQDSTIATTLIPLQAIQKKNIAIDSCWFESPVPMLNQTNNLVVKLRNFGENDENNVRLTVTHNGQVKPVGNMAIDANSVKYDTIPITIMNTGWHRCEVEITDYPITFDDHYFVAFKVAQNLKILSIDEGGGAAYLDAVFKGASYFQLSHQSAGGVDYSKLKEYNLIIINGLRTVSSGLSSELQAYSKSGGNVLVFPNNSADLTSYNSFLNAFGAGTLQRFETAKRQVGFINTDEFTFNDVYLNTNANNLKLPETNGNFALSHGSNEEILLRYRDGGIFVSKYKNENGNLFLCASPLEVQYSNLVKNAEVFVPMVYKMALARGGKSRIGYTIGKDNSIETENRSSNIDKNTYKLAISGAKAATPETQTPTNKGKSIESDEQTEFIPEQRNLGARLLLSFGTNIRRAGFYDLYIKKDSVQSVFAFNYDRRESPLDYLDQKSMSAFGNSQLSVLNVNASTNFVQLVGERSRGILLWKWCIIFALLFLLAEELLVRFWKR
ncbi:MAG: hypothetical protein RI894_654 [Bacteroidota bacterium]